MDQIGFSTFSGQASSARYLEDSENFLEDSRLTETNCVDFWSKAYLYSVSSLGLQHQLNCFKRYLAHPKVLLDKSNAVTDFSFEEVVRNRRSHSIDNTIEPLSQIRLSYVLQHGLFSSLSAAHGELQQGFKKPYPAAGGLYAVENYVAALNVEDFEPGILHLCGKDDGLYRIRDIDPIKVQVQALGIPSNSEARPSAAIIQTFTPERTVRKYGTRGTRFSMIECGAACQNLLLAATACNVGSVVWGGYLDNELDAILGLNGADETVVNVVLLTPGS